MSLILTLQTHRWSLVLRLRLPRLPRADAQRAVQGFPRRERRNSRQRKSARRATHGGEAGVGFASSSKRFNVRGTVFWLEITRPIANVTLNDAPELITRQRQNLGRTRSRGAEVDAEMRLTDRLSLSASYQLTDAAVVRFPSNKALEGLRIPQVPRHMLTFRIDYRKSTRYTLSLQGRASGSQFDDDLNRFRLDHFLTLGALAFRKLARDLEVFVALENLTGRRYQVGRTPLITLGPPLFLRVGMKIHFGPL